MSIASRKNRRQSTLVVEDASLVRQIARSCLNGWRSTVTESHTAIVDKSAPLLQWSKTYLPHYFTKSPSLLHEWLAEKVHDARTNRGRYIDCVGPRGGAKSTVGNTANILRCACEQSEPYIWIICETQPLAAKQLNKVKQELEKNELLARDYPEACGKGDEWSSLRIRLRNGVVIEGVGKGQAIRGSGERADRPTLIVCDDLQDDKVIPSPDQRQKDWDWFTGSVLNAGDYRTNFINLANALHREAIGMRLLTSPGWEPAVFSAIVEYPANMDLWAEWEAIYCNVDNANAVVEARAFYDANRAAMDEGAKLLWSDWEDLYSLMRMRVKSRSAFEREKQSRPVNPDECEWPEDYFDDRIWFDEWPQHYLVKAVSLDPSKGREAKTGDYSAFTKLMVTQSASGEFVLYVECDQERRPTPKMVADGVDICIKFGPDVFTVEGNAWQDLLGPEFERTFNARGIWDAGVSITDNTVPKIVRIRRLGKYLETGRMKFKRNSPGTMLAISQMKDFPVGDHDDGPDSIEMAVRKAGEFYSQQVSHSQRTNNVLTGTGFQ